VEIPARLFPAKETETPTVKPAANLDATGSGRKDFQMIFAGLKRKGVKKIIRLVVDDDAETPHSDEVIEELSCFEIEEWDWRRIDLCSERIKIAAPRVRTLSLYSSGNSAVLWSWSGVDGLPGLEYVRHPVTVGFAILELHFSNYRFAYNSTARGSQTDHPPSSGIREKNIGLRKQIYGAHEITLCCCTNSRPNHRQRHPAPVAKLVYTIVANFSVSYDLDMSLRR